jgi:5'-deoxynucleotidase YfbR-like HD superfamily hydrolase
MNVLVLLILGGLALLTLVFGLYVLLYRKQRLSQRESEKVRELWREIEKLRKDHPEQALLKADKLLEFALEKAGYTGTLADKLKSSAAVFSDQESVWSAHKLRNRMVHEVDVRVTPLQAKAALRAFKKALIDLGVSL